MKGVIFTLKRRSVKRGFPALKAPDLTVLKQFIRRRGSLVFFIASMTAGLIVGSASVNSFDKKTLYALDFLFTTNLPEKLKGGFAGAFFAGFSSDFLFFIAAVFCSLSLFGGVFLPAIAFFKGFGIGVSAAYLISNYAFKGALFYILIILPGVFVFGMILVYELSEGLSVYKKLFLNIVRGSAYPAKGALAAFFRKSVKLSALTLAVSAGDAALWFLFSGMFKF
ncbi:MAG: hypothetical protein IIU39_00685 [Ruminococcus sp.]|nr:hypothetical protein [Ruminococcus sp.]